MPARDLGQGLVKQTNNGLDESPLGMSLGMHVWNVSHGLRRDDRDGGYACNHVYFRTLWRLRGAGANVPSVFAHVKASDDSERIIVGATKIVQTLVEITPPQRSKKVLR